MKPLNLLKYLIVILSMAQPLFAGDVTVTLVGINPLTINVKGNTQNEEAGSISIYLYFRDDGTTDIGSVDASQLVTNFGWGTTAETNDITTGTYNVGGHSFTKRLSYANADIGDQNDFWTTSGINAIVIDFSAVGSGHVYIELNGADAFADWSGTAHNVTLANQDIALPVELTSFNAKAKGSIVELLWQTSTEVNNYGFEIERKADNNESANWEKVGFVDGSGNSNSPKDYTFTDKNLIGGSEFAYRLKQVDNDGTYSYSNEVEVTVVPDKYELYQNYPNPFNPVTNIKFSLPEVAKVKVDIFNIIGEKVRTLIDQNMEAGFHSIAFNAENLSSGTYIYRLQTENFTQIKKMLLMK
jgi:hypothetical protein